MLLPLHSYRLRSKRAGQTRLFNCYAVKAPPEGKSPTMIQGMAGTKAFATIAKSPQRAAIKFNNTLYSVAGDSFYSVDSAGNETSIGSLTGVGAVDIDQNTSQIAILIEPDLWVFDGSTLTQVTDADFTSRGAKRMAVLDSFGAFIEPNSGRWFICDLDDFTVYDPLDFATAEAAPDNLRSIESTSAQFVLFGETTSEVWDLVGGTGFPAERNPNGVIECGCGAAYSTCKADNTVYWIDEDRLPRRLEGNTPRLIGDDGVTQQWQSYTTISDAIGFSYVYDGHTFVVFQFPSAGTTWTYDINTQEWHERGSYADMAWRAAWVLKCYDKTLVGDTQSGDIGELDATTYTEWGETLLREATTGVITQGGDYLRHLRLELQMDVGKGTVSGQGSDPVVMMDVSDNGGETFRAVSSRSLGVMGALKTRVSWDGLGRSLERVYRWRVTDPVPFNINAANLDARP